MASRRLRLLVLVLLIATGGLLGWLLHDRNGGTEAGAPIERADAPPEAPFEDAALHGPPDAEPASTPPPAPAPEPPPEKPWRLTFDVVDEDGTPRHWMRAEIHDARGRVLLQQWSEDGPQTEGKLAVAGGGYFLVWSHARVPWVSDWLEPPPSGARHLEVRVDTGLAVAGEVFEQDGVTPLPWGEVHVWCPASKAPYRPALGAVPGIVQAGRFRVEGLPPGPATVEAKAHDYVQGRKVKVETEAGDETLRLVLGPQGVILFLVVDRATGLAPVTKYLEIRTLEADGSERGWTATSSTQPGEPKPAEPIGKYLANPGDTCRFRVHAQGYEPSEVVVVAVPETGGKLTARVELDAAPESVARLTLLVRTLDLPLPKWVMVTRHRDGGSTGHGMAHEDGRVVVELSPGTHHLSVGGSMAPTPGKDFWLPTHLEIELQRDDVREVEVWIERGGWVFIAGDPDPRPNDVVFRQGDVTIVRDYRWQSWNDETGYFLGVLPEGAWTFEYSRRRKGRRGTVEVRKGEVTRLDPATIDSFTIEEED